MTWPEKISTGVSGLDDILRGGLAANRLYLVEGMPVGQDDIGPPIPRRGYAETLLAKGGLLKPGMHVMAKPFTMDELAERIRDVIAGP